MIHWSAEGLINETRWIPFHHMRWEDHTPTRMKDVPMDDVIPLMSWEEASPQYMAILNAGGGGEGDESWDWARGKTIIFIGSSSRHP